MNRFLDMRTLLASAMAFAFMLPSCRSGAGRPPASARWAPAELTGVEALRAQFNRDRGQARLILILSPT